MRQTTDLEDASKLAWKGRAADHFTAPSFSGAQQIPD
jgi:hypothetical protein